MCEGIYAPTCGWLMDEGAWATGGAGGCAAGGGPGCTLLDASATTATVPTALVVGWATNASATEDDECMAAGATLDAGCTAAGATLDRRCTAAGATLESS